MKFLRSVRISVLAAAIAAMAGVPAFAAGSVVKVTLWDKGAGSMGEFGPGTRMGMNMEPAAKLKADLAKATVGINAAPYVVPAGEVTLEVTNSSKDMVHEMIIAPVTGPGEKLPYDEDLQKVDEDAAGHLGEVAELDPGSSGALRLTLKPGTYILYCNIPGHYALGMWHLLTVK
jgi:uncharacterized cupredoxin-like copper-binding protein